MKTRLSIAVGLTGLLLFMLIGLVWAQDAGPQSVEAPQAALGTAFTYQGQLQSGGKPVSDTCDFNLYLYDSLAGSGLIGTPNSRTAKVTNGYFTLSDLNFGSDAFNGEARWLRIDVRCPTGAGGFTTLSPRQPLTPAPYALALPGLYTQQNATSPNVIGGYSGNVVSPTRVGAVIGGGGASGFENSVQADHGTIGGGKNNDVRGFGGAIGGGNGNIAGYLDAIGGGKDNTAWGSYSTVPGGRQNIAGSDYATVGGGNLNSAAAVTATIGGGEHINVTGQASTVAGGSWITVTGDYAGVGGGARNTVLGDYATVGGGLNNIAKYTYDTIGGGTGNTADLPYATVGGGSSNTARGNHATVVGGASNEAIADYAFIGGGSHNAASGYHSTIPGGSDNAAAGSYSFAAGSRAQSNHNGTFVWADSTNGNFASTANNQFLIRANGGVGINTNSTYTNALTVNGRVIAGGTGVPVGSAESFVARGSNAGLSLDDRSDADLRWVVYANSGSLRFWNGAERMSVNGTGILTIGGLGSGGEDTLCRNASNQIAACSSSLRYKNNIAALALGLETIARLRPVTFDWTSNGEHDLGFVAEEVDQITPLLTTRNAEGQIEGVKYDRVSAVLVNAVQQQQQQIAELKQQNVDLQTQLARLDQTARPAAFNLFNVLSVLAFGAVIYFGWQQRRSKRGES